MLKKRKFKGKLAILLISTFVCIFTFLLSIPKTYAWYYEEESVVSSNIVDWGSPIVYNNATIDTYTGLDEVSSGTSNITYYFACRVSVGSITSNQSIKIYKCPIGSTYPSDYVQASSYSIGTSYANSEFVWRATLSVDRSVYNALAIYFTNTSGGTITLKYCMVTRQGQLPNDYDIDDFEPYQATYTKVSNNLNAFLYYTIQYNGYKNGAIQSDSGLINLQSSQISMSNYAVTYNGVNYGSNSTYTYIVTRGVTGWTIANNLKFVLDNGVKITIIYSDDTSDTYTSIVDDYAYIVNNSKYIREVQVNGTYGKKWQYVLNGGSYSDGYSEGMEQGYNQGYSEGMEQGYNQGYNQGESVGGLENNGIKTLINTILSYPINMLKGALNFEIFGINVSAIVLFGLTLGLVLFVIKKFWK